MEAVQNLTCEQLLYSDSHGMTKVLCSSAEAGTGYFRGKCKHPGAQMDKVQGTSVQALGWFTAEELKRVQQVIRAA